MFNLRFNKRDHGLIALAIGAGIFFSIILPPWGWMICCGTVLIVVGVFCVKNY